MSYLVRQSPFSTDAGLRLRASAFTLVELLAVIAVVGILAAIVISTVGKVGESARRTDCSSNMRQIAQALLLYAQDHKKALPAVSKNWPPGSDQRDTWGYAVWTYAGYAESAFDAAKNGLASSATYQGQNLFHCKNTRTGPTFVPGVNTAATGWTSYGLNDGPLYGTGQPTRTTPVILNSIESPARTAMLLESRFYWANDYAYKTQFGLIPHNGATNVVFYDGHVELKTWPEIEARGGQDRLFWSGKGVW